MARSVVDPNFFLVYKNKPIGKMRGVFSRNNQSGIIITDLEIPLDVIEISLQSSGIVDIPKYFFMKFFLLESLNLQNNNITSLPDLPPSLSILH